MARNLRKGDSSGGEMSEFDRKMKTRYGEVRKNDKGVPWACDCSAAIHIATSHEPTGTRGLLYFVCPYEFKEGRGEGCGFRRWWIPALQDEFVKIRDEKNEMKEELANAKKQIEDHEATIFEMIMRIDDLQKKYEELSLKYERLNQYL